MIQVQVDGQTLSTDVSALRTMGELIEFIKSTIDPDVMITSILFDGEPLSDQDWNAPLVVHRGRTLQISSGTKERYLADRLLSAEDIVGQVIGGFHQVADSYRLGYHGEGSQRLNTSTNDLLALLNWMGALLMIDPARYAAQQIEFKKLVDEIRGASEELLQHQLYAAWWPLAETVSSKLIPRLEAFKAFAGRLALTAQTPRAAA